MMLAGSLIGCAESKGLLAIDQPSTCGIIRLLRSVLDFDWLESPANFLLAPKATNVRRALVYHVRKHDALAPVVASSIHRLCRRYVPLRGTVVVAAA